MTDLAPYLPQLAIAWMAYFIATASPGPAIVAIIATSISQGRRAGLALALGVLTGSYIWAILTASGLSALIRTYGEAIIVLKIVGGCYLLWCFSSWGIFFGSTTRRSARWRALELLIVGSATAVFAMLSIGVFFLALGPHWQP